MMFEDIDKKTYLLGIFLVSIVLVLSFSIINAQNTSEEVPINITMNSNSTFIEFSLDPEVSYENVYIKNESNGDLQEINLSFEISEVLNAFNGRVELKKDSKIVSYETNFSEEDIIEVGLINISTHNVSKNNSDEIKNKIEEDTGFTFSLGDFNFTSYYVINNITAEVFATVENGTIVFLSILAENKSVGFNDLFGQNNFSLETESEEDMIFTRNGTNYSIWIGKGYGDNNDMIEDKINESIEESFNETRLNSVVSKITLFLDSHDSILNDYGLDSSLLGKFGPDYNIQNQDKMQIKNGMQTISLSGNNSGGEAFTQRMNILLEGLDNIEKVNVENGTYAPSTEKGIGEFINNIKNLNASEISIELLSSLDSKPNNVNAIKYFNITPNQESNASINFKINKFLIKENLNLVSLYRLNESVWEELDTRFDGEEGGDYLFSAETPGFSIFLIGEEILTSNEESDGDSSSGGSGGSGGSDGITGGIISGTTNDDPNEDSDTTKNNDSGGEETIEVTDVDGNKNLFSIIKTNGFLIIFALIFLVAAGFLIIKKYNQEKLNKKDSE